MCSWRQGVLHISHRSVAWCSHLSFPPSATVPSIENVGEMQETKRHLHFWFMWSLWCCSWAKTAVISSVNSCPSNRCQKWTIVVHLLASWGSFGQCPTHSQCNLHPTFKGRIIWNCQEFVGKDPGPWNGSVRAQVVQVPYAGTICRYPMQVPYAACNQ